MISSLLFDLSYRRFLSACRDPLSAQTSRLRRILRQARHTVIGRANDFAGLARIPSAARMIESFQERIPIRSYGEMRPVLDAVYAGDWQQLCPSRPLYFSMTAGSTGQFKYLPVTPEFRRDVGGAAMIFYGALQASYPSLRRLKAQFLVGSAEGGHSPGGPPQGFASGFNYRNLPPFLRGKFLLPYWIFTLDDAEERSYAAGRILVGDRRLGALSAIAPGNLINLRQALERHAERLFDDLASGGLTVHGPSAVEGRYRGRPDADLSARLRKAWQAEGRLPNRLLFPSLEVLVCWQGGNMSYYLPELARAFELDRHFEFPISASEGVFAIPTRANEAGGMLAVTSHFLEFLPDNGASPGANAALRADQLSEGQCYRLVVTNSGGLYRYDMEDIIRVREFSGPSPVIEFISKKDRQISVANERLTERDVTVAMQTACGHGDFWPRAFLFVPCSDRKYRVMIDGADITREDPLPALAIEIEHQLRGAARGYDFEREDALLGPLDLVVTAPGELHGYLQRQRGQQERLPNAQIKPLHLTPQFNLHQGFTAIRTYAA